MRRVVYGDGVVVVFSMSHGVALHVLHGSLLLLLLLLLVLMLQGVQLLLP